jgi:hypothetical protein
MQIAAKRNLVLTEFSSTEMLAGLQTSSRRGAFYQQFTAGLFKAVYNKQFFYNLAEKLACIAHNAYMLRHIDVIEQASLILQSLPISSEYKNVGSYYQALSMKKQGRVTEACILLESIVDHMPIRYRARGTQLLGMIHHANGDLHSALTLYVDACKIAASNNGCDPHTTVTAFQNIAVIKSMNGDHKQAIVGLEQLFPVVQAISKVEPYKYHHYLNSYAVELGEVGRLEEAQNVCRIVLASPFAFAYPEWRETANEVALRGYKSRSSVPVIQSFLEPKKAKNVLRLPERERPESTRCSPFFQPSDVTSLEDWKNKMVKEPNGENGDESNIDEMSDKDILFEIMNLTSEDNITREQLKEILDAVRKITSKKP